jgi:uncharacterized membrane protein HdeD (DUF308 family)
MENKNEQDMATSKKSYHKKWMLFAPIGLLLVGAGLCVFGTALAKMRENAEFAEWFVWGTASLILINGGLCFFGSAIKYSILYELAAGREK